MESKHSTMVMDMTGDTKMKIYDSAFVRVSLLNLKRMETQAPTANARRMVTPKRSPGLSRSALSNHRPLQIRTNTTIAPAAIAPMRTDFLLIKIFILPLLRYSATKLFPNISVIRTNFKIHTRITEEILHENHPYCKP